MSRRMSAKKAADQIETLIRGDHYKTPEAVAKALPELAPGVDECKRRQEAQKKRQEASRPVGSGPALLSR